MVLLAGGSAQDLQHLCGPGGAAGDVRVVGRVEQLTTDPFGGFEALGRQLVCVVVGVAEQVDGSHTSPVPHRGMLTRRASGRLVDRALRQDRNSASATTRLRHMAR